MIELLELKFSRRWQTNKIESDWSNSPRHSSSRQFRSPRQGMLHSTIFYDDVLQQQDDVCHTDLFSPAMRCHCVISTLSHGMLKWAIFFATNHSFSLFVQKPHMWLLPDLWHVRLVDFTAFQATSLRVLSTNQKYATCCLFTGYEENCSPWPFSFHRFLSQQGIVANRRRKSFIVTLAIFAATCLATPVAK